MANNAMNSLYITIVHISYANMEFNSIFAKIRFFLNLWQKYLAF